MQHTVVQTIMVGAMYIAALLHKCQTCAVTSVSKFKKRSVSETQFGQVPARVDRADSQTVSGKESEPEKSARIVDSQIPGER